MTAAVFAGALTIAIGLGVVYICHLLCRLIDKYTNCPWSKEIDIDCQGNATDRIASWNSDRYNGLFRTERDVIFSRPYSEHPRWNPCKQ